MALEELIAYEKARMNLAIDKGDYVLADVLLTDICKHTRKLIMEGSKV